MFGKKTRCPSCGALKRHKKVIPEPVSFEQKEMQKKIEELSPLGGGGRQRYVCKECSHVFSEGLAREWEIIALKLGDLRAIHDYNKVRG